MLVVGSFCVAQVDRSAGQESIQVRRRRRVTTEQPMVTEDPKIALLSDCLVWRLGDLVRIGQAFIDAGIHQLRKFLSVESEEPEVVVRFLQCRQFDRQQVIVPLSDLSGLVVGDAISTHLLWCEVRRDNDRHSLEAEFLCGLQSRMADDDDAVVTQAKKRPTNQLRWPSCNGRSNDPPKAIETYRLFEASCMRDR